MEKKKIKVLAVDDSESNLIALQAVFSGTDFDIIEAHSGAEALKILTTNQEVAVVLLDVQMPEMDGFETALKIKKLEHYHDIPIIFITAVFHEDPFIRKGYEVGAIDYFSKPFDPEILKTKVAIYAANKQKSLLLKERERRINETEELLATGKKLSSMLESLPVGVLIADVDGKICQTNHEVSRILCSDLSPNNDEYGVILGWWDKNGKVIKQNGGPLEKALHLGQASHSEVVKVKCMDGSIKTLYASASPLKGTDGHIVGAGLVIQDVTESKRMFEDLEGKIMNLISLSVELTEATQHNASH